MAKQTFKITNWAKAAMAGLPLWQLGAESGFLSKEASVLVRELERWMVPNKLTNKVPA